MNAGLRRIVTVSVGGIVYLFCFVLAGLARWPVLWYQPVERQWRLSSLPPPGTVAMDLYGRTLVAAAAGLVAAWIAHTIAGRATKSSEDEGIPIIFSFLLIAFAAAAAYFVFTLAFRTPQGIVLPGVTP